MDSQWDFVGGCRVGEMMLEMLDDWTNNEKNVSCWTGGPQKNNGS